MVMRPSNHSPKPVPTARPAEARLRAGVFREGAALFGRGLENPPNPIRSAPTRSRGGRVCSRRPWGSGTGAALFGGGLGEPPQPLSAPPRRGVGVGGSAAGDLGDRGRAHGRAPLRNGDQSRSGGRVQRGRSPLWWGCGGTPQPCPLRPDAESGWAGLRQATLGTGDGRTAVRPYGTGTRAAPAGESREGAALFGGGVGVPPQPCPLRPDAESGWADVWSGDCLSDPIG